MTFLVCRESDGTTLQAFPGKACYIQDLSKVSLTRTYDSHYKLNVGDHIKIKLTDPLVSLCVLNKYKIPGECLLISSLPGKASRTLVESRGLPSDSTCVLEAEPGKLDIKLCELGFLFICLQVG